MSCHDNKPILIQLRDNNRNWHITVHANDPRGFGRGLHEGVERHLRHYKSFPDFDGVVFLVGTLTPTGSKWDYDWHRWRRCLASDDGANEINRIWDHLVAYEQEQIANSDPARDAAIQQHIESAPAVGHYINAILPALEMDSGTGPLAAWFY